MADIIPFRRAVAAQPEEYDIDLFTAVDAAIRDLNDIAHAWGSASALRQVEECRQMLIDAYENALR